MTAARSFDKVDLKERECNGRKGERLGGKSVFFDGLLDNTDSKRKNNRFNGMDFSGFAVSIILKRI